MESGGKIAKWGLRVRRGCSFNGLSLNGDMDLWVFQGINPGGHVGMEVTDILRQAPQQNRDMARLMDSLSRQLATRLGYSSSSVLDDNQLPEL